MSISVEELRSYIFEFYDITGRAVDEKEINFLIECVGHKDYRDVVISSNDKEFVTLITGFALFFKAQLRKHAIRSFLAGD